VSKKSALLCKNHPTVALAATLIFPLAILMWPSLVLQELLLLLFFSRQLRISTWRKFSNFSLYTV
jgi:hypothetical protein